VKERKRERERERDITERQKKQIETVEEPFCKKRKKRGEREDTQGCKKD
jgi:hypothetical protein